MTTVHVDALGLAGPGLLSWHEAARLIAGESVYRVGESPPRKVPLEPLE